MTSPGSDVHVGDCPPAEWTDRNGRITPITAMVTYHLVTVVKHLRHEAQKLYRLHGAAPERPPRPGEYGDDNEDWDVEQVPVGTCWEDYVDPRYTVMVEELRRRDVTW